MEDNSRDWTIGTIVENMAYREPCIEFQRIFKKCRNAPPGLDTYISQILEDTTTDPAAVFAGFVHKYGCFQVKGKAVHDSLYDTLSQIPMVHVREAYAARLFTGLFLLNSNNRFDMKVYVILGKDDVAQYKNKPFVQNKSWKILRRERKYVAEIPPDDMRTTFHDNWLSHAYGSPIWRHRIVKYGGTLVDGEIHFASEEKEECFYLWYDMEPDEQSSNIMLCNRTFTSWTDIHSKYACEPFNEWASIYTLSV
jgi:hypothetical protein